jgi:hypothetical protein
MILKAVYLGDTEQVLLSLKEMNVDHVDVNDVNNVDVNNVNVT